MRFYHLDKPVIIGEFGINEGGTEKEKKYWRSFVGKKYKGIYRKGFNGALMWGMVGEDVAGGSDGAEVCMAGMKVLRAGEGGC